MRILPARPQDNAALQALQEACPQGRGLVVSTVNTPDFFARARCYPHWRVWAAWEGEALIGSGAYGLRPALINGRSARAAHQFQLFVHPDQRRGGVAVRLMDHMDRHVRRLGAALTYALIMEGNTPSLKLVESLGFVRQRLLCMRVLPVLEQRNTKGRGLIRSLLPEDLPAAAELLNRCWQGYELYEPCDAASLAALIARTPALEYENIFLLERSGQLQALVGFWDWSLITRVTVLTFEHGPAEGPLSAMVRPGMVMSQYMLAPVAGEDPEDLAVLTGRINNLALERGVGQIFCLAEPVHPLMTAVAGWLHLDTPMHLMVKPVCGAPPPRENPVYISGLDL